MAANKKDMLSNLIKGNIYIHWADGLQPLMEKLIASLQERNDLKVYILCMSESLADQARKIVKNEEIIVPPQHFDINKASTQTKDILQTFSSLIYYSERHFFLDKSILNRVYEGQKNHSIEIDLINRCAFFCDFMERRGGIMVSEFGSDMLSSMASLLQFRLKDFKNLTVQTSRLFVKNKDLFFYIGYEFEKPLPLVGMDAIEIRRYKESTLKRTIKLFKSSINSSDIFAGVIKKIVHGPHINKNKNINKIIFFPLQFFPENTTLGETLGTVDQIWVINTLARSIPIDAELWIKDHFVETASDNNRLQVLEKLPNVRIIPSSITAAEILNDVDLVVTQTSSVGIEAIYRNIPVICFGNPMYSGHPLVKKINLLQSSLVDLRSEIFSSLSSVNISIQNKYHDVMDKLFVQLINNSFLSTEADGVYPYTDPVVNALVKGIDYTLAPLEHNDRD